MADNSRAINRVFTRKVISDLVQDGKSDVFDYVVKRYVEDPSGKTHGQLISEIYTRLNQQQRNEYFYMKKLHMDSRNNLSKKRSTSVMGVLRFLYMDY